MFNFESSSDEEKNENDEKKGATRSNLTGFAINGDMLESESSDDEAPSPPPKKTTKRQSGYSAAQDGSIAKSISQAGSNTAYFDEKFALKQLIEADKCLQRLARF